jgi:peptidyl-prolyl cis-trans isomerase A (cyclophilin A)
MKQLLLLALMMSAACLPTSFAAETPAHAAAKPPASPLVQVVTSMGNFTIELNAERAPLTVANFLNYVDKGHYNNVLFHRVVVNFVIQGGGFDTEYNLKPAPEKVVNESGNGLSNTRGAVGMARGTDPHGGDAQFYVNLADNAALDPSQTRWGYAVFGHVIQGMDVVDRIDSVATSSHGTLKEDVPLKPIVILRIERVPNP